MKTTKSRLRIFSRRIIPINGLFSMRNWTGYRPRIVGTINTAKKLGSEPKMVLRNIGKQYKNISAGYRRIID